MTARTRCKEVQRPTRGAFGSKLTSMPKNSLLIYSTLYTIIEDCQQNYQYSIRKLNYIYTRLKVLQMCIQTLLTMLYK